MSCFHKLMVLSPERRGGLTKYRYQCMDCGKLLKIHSGIIVARTESEARKYFKNKKGETMNLYLVKRTDEWDYDEYDAFVVRAVDEEAAKNLIMSKEHEGWRIENVKVTLIGTAYADGLEAGVVLGSFNAG